MKSFSRPFSSFLVLSALIAICFFSCEPMPATSVEQPIEILLEGQSIALGEKIENPFSIRAGAKNSPTQASHYYLRFRTDDPLALREFLDLYPEAESFPLDREIVEGGYFYDQPDIDEATQLPWFFIIIKAADLQTYLNDLRFQVEILDELAIPDTPLSTESSRTTGKPYGYVTLKNTVTGSLEPLPLVKVQVNHYLTIASAFTSEQGFFSIGSNFNDWWKPLPTLKIIFDNAQCSIHRDNLLQYFTPVEYIVGGKTVAQMQGATFQIPLDSATPSPVGSAASTLKAVYQYNSYASANGISKPPKLKVLLYGLTNRDPGACWMARSVMTPYFTTIAGTIGAIAGSQAGPVGALLGALAGFGSGALSASTLPDILIPYNPWYQHGGLTRHYDALVFHELSHASHMTVIGNVAWMREYLDKIIGITTGSYTQSDLLIESWAYFSGNNAMMAKYPQHPGMPQ